MTSLTAMAAALVLGHSAPARANLQIQINGTEVGSPISSDTVAFSGTKGGLTFNLLATNSDSPGEGATALLTGASLTVTNKTGSTHTVIITLGDTGFTTPTAPPGYIALNSSVGGSVNKLNAKNALVFQSYVDPTDKQNNLSGFTPGPQTPDITGTSSLSFNDSASTSITSLAATYSITEYFKLTLGPKETLNETLNFGSTTTLTLLPEPSSMAIAGLGMLGMIGYGVRRRRSA
jgi:hypothetical protein